MQQLIYTLAGTITDQNNQPLEGFWVKVIFQKPQQPPIESVEPVRTVARGKYKITFDLIDFNVDPGVYMYPDVFIQVLDPSTNEVLGESKRYEEIQLQTEINLQVTYPLEPEQPKAAPPSATIKGYVQDRLSRPLRNALVELWQEDRFHYTLESEQTGTDGAFELDLEGDLYGIAMECTEFHFRVRYGDKLVANTLEFDPPIVWDIGKAKEDRIEITVPVVGVVKETLQPKGLAVSLAEQAKVALNAFPQTHINLKKKVQELAGEEIKRRLRIALGDAADSDLQKQINTLDFDTCASTKIPIKDLVENHFRLHEISQSQFDAVQKKLEDNTLPKHFSDLLPEDKPLQEIPFLQTLLEEGKGHQLAEVSGLAQKKCNELLRKGWRTNHTDFRMLDALHEESSLTKAQTEGLKQSIELHSLFDENLPLTQALKKGPVPGTSRKLQALKDLVPIRAKEWGNLISGLSNLQLPEGLTPEAYGTVLEKRVERAFPTAAMLDRYQPVRKTDLASDFQTMRSVLQKSPDLLKTKNLEAVDFTGMTKAEVKAFRKSYDSTLKKLNRYHGLNVHRMSKEAIGNGSALDIDTHLGIVESKIQQLETFFQNNADKELLAMDFGPEADFEAQGVNFSGISDENQLGVRRYLKTNQRIRDLAFGDLATANILMENGLYTGTAISNLSITSLSNITQLNNDQIVNIYNRACQRKRQAVDFMAKINDLKSGFQDFAIGNNITRVPRESIDWASRVREADIPLPQPIEEVNFEDEVLRKYDGYEEFFGSLDYCNCNHCSSIFSPAAYFVDLMAWLEKLVLNDVFPDKPNLPFEQNPKNHRLHLQNRRPDLWYLDLSCENTNTLIPYLDIINEVLENYIYFWEESNNEDNFEYYKKTAFETIQLLEGKRSVILNQVYRNIYEEEKIYSIDAPFLLPLEELKVYLQHFPISLEEVAEALNKEDRTLTRARLGISENEYDIIAKSYPYSKIDSVASLRLLFNTELIDDDDNPLKLDVQDLISALGISRKELGLLVQTRFLNYYLDREPLKIIAQKLSEKDIQNNIEKLEGLDVVDGTIPYLDKLHRFVRLWRKTPWSIHELDLVLNKTVNEYAIEPETGLQKEYEKVGKILGLFNRFDKPIDEILVLFSVMDSVENGTFGRLFNERFNKPPFTDKQRYPKNDFFFIHPVLDPRKEAENNNGSEDIVEESPMELSRLIAGLGITDDVLYQLIKKDSPLAEPLNSIDSNEDYIGFTLELHNLSLLYRHARLAEWLQLSIPELFKLLHLEPDIEGDFIDHGKIDHLEKLLDFYDWWKTTEYSLDELEFLLSRNQEEEKVEKAKKLTEEIVTRIKSDKALVFADTVFAYLDGVTEEQSRQILLANQKHEFKGIDNKKKFVLPQNLDIKDKNGSAADSPYYSRDEVVTEITEFLKNQNADVVVNSQLFHTNRTEIGLANTLTPEVSSLLFFLNESFFQLSTDDSENLVKKADLRVYRVKKSANVSSLNDGLSTDDKKLSPEQLEFLEAHQKSGAATFTLDELHQLKIDFSKVEAVLEIVPQTDLLELTALYSDNFAVPAHIPITKAQLNEGIARFRMDTNLFATTAQVLDISTEKVLALNKLSGIDAIEHSHFKSNPDNVTAWVKAIYTLSLVYKAKEYEVLGLEETESFAPIKDGFIAELPSQTSSDSIDQAFLQNVNDLRPFISKEKLADLTATLDGYNDNEKRFNEKVYNNLIVLLDSEMTPIKLVDAQKDLGDNAIQRLVNLSKQVHLSEYLGMGGDVLHHLLSDDYNELTIARNALLSAFRLKYQDEKQWEEKIEPFQDKIRGLKRDALTDYLIKGLDKVSMGDTEARLFPNKREIYKHFLIDTELEGCARTSRLVAAISSVQLFIQRIQLNLETSQDRSLVIEPQGEYDKALFKNQWEWRKNYRVWEANRKVFLYPENYIEPELRDNKTELFKELETDLLQREVTQETVEEAYKKYLDGFEEVNNLQVAGAYHEKNIQQKVVNGLVSYLGKDTLHLFATSSSAGNGYYYRKIENPSLHFYDWRPINWNSWIKVNGKCSSKKVTPVINSNKLYLFWNEITSKKALKKYSDTQAFVGYEHKIKINYTSFNLTAKLVPRTLNLGVSETYGNLLKLREYLILTNKFINRSEEIELRKKFDELVLSEVEGSIRNEDRRTISDIEINNSLNSMYFQFLNSQFPKGNDLKVLFENIQYYVHWSSQDDSAIGSRVVRGNTSIEISKELFEEAHYILEYDNDGMIFQEPLDTYHLEHWKWNQPFIVSKEGYLQLGLPDTGRNLLINDLNNFEPVKTTSHREEFNFWIKSTISNRFEYFLMPISESFFQNASLMANEFFNNGYEGIYAMDRPTLPQTSNIRLVLSGSEIATFVHGKSFDEIIVQDANSIVFLVEANRNYNQLVIGSKTSSTSHNGTEADISSMFEILPIWNFLGRGNQNSLKNTYSFKELTNTYGLVGMDRGSVIGASNPFSLSSPNQLYFWELFFHIPFLIANHFNSQQKFAEAQQWYHYIFNPTALIPQAQEEENTNSSKSYVWQFRAFYDRSINSMRKHLKDPTSIRVYENDPFDPHAIARTRISAYQKTIVMKYIDNLLDWGDHLFAQDTMESINEATMLYTLAYEILGDRPADIGDCGEKKGKKTYQSIKSDSILAENKESQPIPIFIEEVEAQQLPIHTITGSFINTHFVQLSTINLNTPEVCSEETSMPAFARPVFCIPKNKDLMAYWDRVDDRLFKIRNCMNIQGIKRDLSLFAPEIDPRLLVRAKAQGLSIQEALESLNGQLPPYRFLFLMAKAKEYVGLVQGFAAALQGALERKDVEYLTELQATHQKNIQSMSRYIRDRELEAAEANLEALSKRKQATQNRLDHYSSLVSTGLSSGERAQISYKNTADGLYVTSLAMSTIAGILGMTPNIVGMSNEVVPAFKALSIYSSYFKFFAELNNLKSSAAGLNANFARRTENWKFQLSSTKDELKVIEEQIKGAEISKVITQRNYEIFDQNVEQQDEVFEFVKDKFSNLGLYTWLSAELMRLYRQAWSSAHTMAKMAERAYRFERSDDTSPLLAGGYWDGSRQGLLAGQKLMIDLQNLERRYLETHHRKMEVDQSFSLMQIDPIALLNLKQNGECNFEIPELFFDLAYPGQYKRRIRSARLTIPCIVGPYVNVGATLSLTGSRIRVNANDDNLKEMPPTRTTTIATSTAQNDSGVFEFSFRDERYMPFEGAGAISDWHLKLPNSFRTFDYNTINDIILHISYEADYDWALAEKVEEGNAEISHSIIKILKEDGLARMFSLRQEFSDSFHKLLYQAGGKAEFKIRDKHFPIFVQSHLSKVKLEESKIIVVSDLRQDEMDGKEVKIKINEGNDITLRNETSNLESLSLLSSLLSEIQLFNIPGTNSIQRILPSEVKNDNIKDVLVYFKYKLDS